MCMSAGRSLALTKSGRLAVPVLTPPDEQMVLRKGQKVAYALPAKSEVIILNVAETSCPQPECRGCQESKANKVEEDLTELEERLTAKQLDKRRAVLIDNPSVFAKNIADVGRYHLVQRRIDLEVDAVPHHEGARRMAPWKDQQPKAEVRHLRCVSFTQDR